MYKLSKCNGQLTDCIGKIFSNSNQNSNNYATTATEFLKTVSAMNFGISIGIIFGSIYYLKFFPINNQIYS